MNRLESAVIVHEKYLGTRFTLNVARENVSASYISDYPEDSAALVGSLDAVLASGGYPVYDVYMFTATMSTHASAIEIVPDHVYIRCGAAVDSGYNTLLAEGVTPVEARDVALAYLRML